MGLGHNSAELEDSQEKALFFQHKASYVAALAKFKYAQKALLDVGKSAKKDLGKHAVSLIKIAIDLTENETGVEDLKARLDREAKVARWMGLPIGAQGSLFDPDRRTAEERAHQEGFESGAGGTEYLKVPEKYGASSPAGQAFTEGWHKGQESIFNIKKKDGAPLFRDTLVMGEPEAAEAHEVYSTSEDEEPF